MEARTPLRRLTEREIANAIQQNGEDENMNRDFYSDEEEAADNVTDSEEDYIPEPESSSSGEEDEQIEDGQNDRPLEMQPLVYLGRDSTVWSGTQTRNQRSYVRRPIEQKVNLRNGQHLDTNFDCFRTIFDNEVFDIIVRFTNIEAKKKRANWKDVDRTEIIAFIGLLIAAGVDRSSKRNYEEFFGVLRGMAIFRATMGLLRFRDIMCFIRFDDKNTRSLRRMRDKLAPIRDIFDRICAKLRRMYSPGSNLTIDEQLIPFRGRCAFKQYIPSKPDKYGMKLFWICDAVTWYPLFAIPYLGREQDRPRRVNVGADIVRQLCEPYYRSHRNVTFDNFFTSYELAQNLRSNGLTCVGTVRMNKTFVPPEFKPNRNRPVGSNLFGFRQNITLYSHVPRANKAVVILSTKHLTAEFGENGMATINSFYNQTKGGVDVLDQMCHTYSAQRRTNRWPFAYFMNLINVGGIASFVIWRHVNARSNEPVRQMRKHFLTQLAYEMVYNHIVRRSMSGIDRPHQEIIRMVTGMEHNAVARPTQTSPTQNEMRRRCYICPTIRKIKQTCDVCRRNVCNEHSVAQLRCINCYRGMNDSSSDTQ